MNVKSVQIINDLGQNLSGLQICPSFAQSSESEKIQKIHKNQLESIFQYCKRPKYSVRSHKLWGK